MDTTEDDAAALMHTPAMLGQVIERVDSFLDGAGAHTQVVLVPSIRDVHHHAVFPQPPLPLDSMRSRHPQAFTCLPNPAIFSCNEVTVGVVTSDVVKHLSGQEVQRGPPGDRLPNLAGHLLGQQRYNMLQDCMSMCACLSS